MCLDARASGVHGAGMRTVAVMAILAASCGGDERDRQDVTQFDVGPDSGASEPDAASRSTFTWLFEDRLSSDLYCASSGCHDSANANGGQDFGGSRDAAYQSLMRDTVSTLGRQDWPKKIAPGDPDSSYFWIKLSRDNAPLGRMPLARPPLPPDELAEIRAWIEAGANND